MKIKQILLYLILTITLTNVAFAQINFLSHTTDIQTQKDKIIYTIQDFTNLESSDNFKLEIYQDTQLVDNTCSKTLDFDSNSFFKKIICEQNTLIDGDYTLVATITRNSEELSKEITKYTSSNLGKSTIDYEILENETIITIQVESNLEEYQVEHYIPKEIIELLTPENQKELIESELEYEILDQDPIIAWNIDESPKTIQYKIKKNTNPSDLENLDTQINSQSQTYTYLSYILYILIFIIIGVILKPLFSKTKKIKSKNK